ncbi:MULTISPECIES: RNA polymerase sigma factor [unclassified Streptomyces]|uniref:RNA polymerase sigma factor n=1 Tax=unclassified Streptomyces TaxID=2593676 RepID=UPI0033A8AD7F
MSWSDLDDAVQQVRLKLLEEQAKERGAVVVDPVAWVSAVASRVAIDWHRARARDAGLRERLGARWERHPAPPEEHRVLALTVAQVLEQLSPAQRQLLALRFYADLPVREIAELLEIPEGTVKSRLPTGISALRARLSALEVN